MLRARPLCRGVDVAAVRRELLRLGVQRRAIKTPLVQEHSSEEAQRLAYSVEQPKTPLVQEHSSEEAQAAGGQVAISKVARSRLLELAGGAGRLLELEGGAALGVQRRATKSSLVQEHSSEEAQRLVGRSLYQKLPQVVSGVGAQL